MNIYESEKLLGEYLLFHYAAAAEVLPWEAGPVSALGYPVRCVSECIDATRLPEAARALDIGCAVGRSTFELARYCSSVVGLDYSRRFIEAANVLGETGEIPYERADEGDLRTKLIARVPTEIDRRAVSFQVGDAMNLPPDLGEYDVVLMANLIDRLSKPRKCLARIPSLVKPGGQLIITSPYTWLEEFTPRAEWLGGFQRGDERVETLAGLRSELTGAFELLAVKDLPFLIREHARKFQWSVAQASIWSRR